MARPGDPWRLSPSEPAPRSGETPAAEGRGGGRGDGGERRNAGGRRRKGTRRGETAERRERWEGGEEGVPWAWPLLQGLETGQANPAACPGLASRPRARRGRRLQKPGGEGTDNCTLTITSRKTEGVSRCPGKDHSEGAAATEEGTPGSLRGNQHFLMINSFDNQGEFSGGSDVHLSDPVAPSSAGLYFEPEPMSSTPSYFQPREFSTCISCEENPNCLDQIFDSYLQTETLSEPLLNPAQSAPYYLPDGFQANPFCFNQSLTPGSPSDSSTLSGSLDYSYSPAQPPSYASENYSSPPCLDTLNHGYPQEDYSYHHLPSHAQYNCFSTATASVCRCASCEAEHWEALRAAECFYPSTDCVDFAPLAATTNDFYKRETNCDICYS